MESDPFSKVEKHVMDHIKNSAPVAALINESNVLSYDSTASTRKDVVNEADVPDLFRVKTSVTNALTFTSNTVQIVATHSLELSTGTWSEIDRLNPILFAVIASFVDLLFSDELKQLTWNQQPFVFDVDLLSNQIGVSDILENRGIEGLVSVLDFTTTMNFTRNTLISFNQGSI